MPSSSRSGQPSRSVAAMAAELAALDRAQRLTDLLLRTLRISLTCLALSLASTLLAALDPGPGLLGLLHAVGTVARCGLATGLGCAALLVAERHRTHRRAGLVG